MQISVYYFYLYISQLYMIFEKMRIYIKLFPAVFDWYPWWLTGGLMIEMILGIQSIAFSILIIFITFIHLMYLWLEICCLKTIVSLEVIFGNSKLLYCLSFVWFLGIQSHHLHLIQHFHHQYLPLASTIFDFFIVLTLFVRL